MDELPRPIAVGVTVAGRPLLEVSPARGGVPTLVRERADAARNRRKVLAAAQDLFATRGVAEVTMDDVAAAAGVGKGTLYRRFGDKGRLAAALLDERERELQSRILAGPPPLGPDPPPTDPANPGTPAAERLAAFAQAYLELLDTTLDLVLLSQTSTPGARHHTGAHAFWAMHCRLLLQEAGAPDPGLRADVLLAALAADQVRHWRDDRHLRRDELEAGLTRLAHALAAAATDTPQGPGHGGRAGTDRPS